MSLKSIHIPPASHLCFLYTSAPGAHGILTRTHRESSKSSYKGLFVWLVFNHLKNKQPQSKQARKHAEIRMALTDVLLYHEKIIHICYLLGTGRQVCWEVPRLFQKHRNKLEVLDSLRGTPTTPVIVCILLPVSAYSSQREIAMTQKHPRHEDCCLILLHTGLDAQPLEEPICFLSVHKPQPPLLQSISYRLSIVFRWNILSSKSNRN